MSCIDDGVNESTCVREIYPRRTASVNPGTGCGVWGEYVLLVALSSTDVGERSTSRGSPPDPRAEDNLNDRERARPSSSGSGESGDNVLDVTTE